MNKIQELSFKIFVIMLAVFMPKLASAASVTLTVNQNPVCEGSEVTFTATTSGISRITKYQLYKNEVLVTESQTSDTEWSYGMEADVSADYYVIVYNSTFSKNTYTSNTVELIVNPVYDDIYTEVTACDSFYYAPATTWLYESGDYTFNLTSSAGCDSIVTIGLTINESYHTYYEDAACDSIVFFGHVLKETDIYVFEHTTTQDCDSIVTLNLVINDSKHVTIDTVACDYFVYDDMIIEESGLYYFKHTAANGCDSIVTVNLVINKLNPFSIEGDSYVCNNDETLYIGTIFGGEENINSNWSVIGGAVLKNIGADSIMVRWNGDFAEGMVICEKHDTITGCVKSDTMEVTINTYVNEIPNKIVAKINQDKIPYLLIYPNPANDNYRYQWYKGENPIEGANLQYYYLPENERETNIDSIYRVYLGFVVENGYLMCGKYSDYYTAAKSEMTGNFVVSPNPVGQNGSFRIFFNEFKGNTIMSIYSMDGKLVVTKEITDNPTVVNQQLPSGVYIIKTSDGCGGGKFDKIIVK